MTRGVQGEIRTHKNLGTHGNGCDSKSDYELGHGHANALVAYFRAKNKI